MDRASSEWVDWAGSRDLHVELAPRGDRRAALERACGRRSATGGWSPATACPSTRALAADLGLARGTVAEAYAQLTAEGYLTARPGAPTRVAFGGAAEAPAGPLATRVVPRLDLEPGTPDVGAFPREPWLRALRRASRPRPTACSATATCAGARSCATALAAYLGRSRGVVADPDRIVVCAGFNEGLALLLAALPCRTLAMEDPCLDFHRAIVRAAGPRDRADGGRRARRACRGATADAALLTPAHQFPLGATLAPERRAAFVRWARERRDRRDRGRLRRRVPLRPPARRRAAGPGSRSTSSTPGTASKTLAPGPAAGLAGAAGGAGRAGARGQDADRRHDVLEQLALAELISSGALDRHVRRMRARYRRRRDALLALLGDRRTRGIAAGLHLVVEVDDEAAVVAAGAREGVALQGLGRFWHDAGPPGLVIGYAAPPQHAYGAALEALGRALAA